MGYVYIIKNKVNDKVYIGKTNLSVEKRFKQHIRECKKSRCEKRPLYAAMLKHGTDNFYIECLEETQDTS
jgi:group I intron endonuclease